MTHAPDHGHAFDQDYWQQHWRSRTSGPGSMATNPPNPHLVRETAGLTPGTALDAGCGVGAEALWLAARGWRVTAVDISAEALAVAAGRGAGSGVEWVEADLGDWEPETSFDLVMTHYAHPAMPQLDFYQRIAGWVGVGGTLLVVGHLPSAAGTAGHQHQAPAEATATVAGITARLDADRWEVVTAEERSRTVPGHDGRERALSDVVVRARRRG
ncbi:methyltransferase domain-containing protein [Auraticoccus sp. F435]|uniref:Methyltransferase domain-containing protein n=1 Tax=Auraticoccus cholistanensis TaxID=2656650 RepID=A0A6A9UV02_9ACTN|nr:class I SAM-dependent methyltransferase [Auraticoccus cholistanensis]MVA76511.1 methyltransferase domain-containing protein [Auraticoccus cholistanensis]